MDLSFGAVKESCRRVKGRINSPKSIHLRQKIDRESKSWLWKLIRAVFVIGFCFVILYPVLTMISKSAATVGGFFLADMMLVGVNTPLTLIKVAASTLDVPEIYWNAFSVA